MMGATQSNRRDRRPHIILDLDQEIDSTFRSIHRRLVNLDAIVRQLDVNARNLHSSVEHLRGELSKLKREQRRYSMYSYVDATRIREGKDQNEAILEEHKEH